MHDIFQAEIGVDPTLIFPVPWIKKKLPPNTSHIELRQQEEVFLKVLEGKSWLNFNSNIYNSLLPKN
jgi:hypothetical protein